MNGWMMLWTTVLLVALSFFTCLSIAVTIGGFLDIRKMLRQLRRDQNDELANRKSRNP